MKNTTCKILFLTVLLFSAVFVSKPARAFCWETGCGWSGGCFLFDCIIVREIIIPFIDFDIAIDPIWAGQFVTVRFSAHRNWWVGREEDDFRFSLRMTGKQDGRDDYEFSTYAQLFQQMNSTYMLQAFFQGRIFDGKAHLETQLDIQNLKNRAYKDHFPSEQLCGFGTGVRDLGASESDAMAFSMTLNDSHIARMQGRAGVGSAANLVSDKFSRWRQFTSQYCDVTDNRWTTGLGTGLRQACGAGANDPSHFNLDINYTALMDMPRTFARDVAPANMSNTIDQTDIYALSKNLYGHDIPKRITDRGQLLNRNVQELYLRLRSVLAKRNVAVSSFNAIAGMKTEPENSNAAPFLKAVLSDMGVTTEAEIEEVIGENPSYFAQLEILAKTMIQNPDFFVSLYDRPANTERMEALLKAVDMMLDREIYESETRQEMLISVLLSSDISEQVETFNTKFAQ